ncbi:MAG: xanthine dehydrogenase family protein molybdopterin-binding subunit [Alphaproteobacteria bacterium]|nr:xanthine dehydrogenase family protein molybdopterin-binding subunit [Alphaproteobacteria bacterium]
MRGRGRFVADIRLAGMMEAAFVRSPLAHARLGDIEIPDEAYGRVVTAAEMADVKPIRAVSALPGFKPSEQPVLARGKVRHVGEPIALCWADDRALAEDLAAAVLVDFDELPVVSDMLDGRREAETRVHEAWSDNVCLETLIDADVAAVAARAPIEVTRQFRMARQCMAPLEGRAVLADWDGRRDRLVVHSATQIPHVVRTGIAESLGLDQARIHVIAPDVGGGFGYKGILSAEEICICWLAMRLRRPVRWIEDRREHLTAAANAREHHYRVSAYADSDGKILALDAEATVDAGAYSAYPFSAGLEAAQIASILPGPYDFPVYRCQTFSVATNKPPIMPYRGVARPGVCYVMESMVDAIARAVGREPHEVRLANLVPPEAMPFDNIAGKHFDSGDYPECLRRAVAAIDVAGVRARQKTGEEDGRLIGIGLAIFSEQAAHGTAVYAAWGIPMIPGHEQAAARLTPDGDLELKVGVHSHGQGLETALAQIAHEVLGIDPGQVEVVHGDTDLTPYSTGTWGSRCIVMAGGAAAAACTELSRRAVRIGAHLLQADPAEVAVAAGRVVAAAGSVSLADVARAWYLTPQDLPETVDTGGLEVTAGYKPVRDDGTFSYAAHAAVVAVDPELGAVEILDYVVVEDGGVMINPMIVDGQVLGGAAQGIGTALYEEMPFDDEGQPLASTLADYMLPGAAEVPDIRILHMETPSPYTVFGQKGIGEGGAIGPLGALANAVNDALHPLGAWLGETPITPRRVLAAIREAGS